MFFKAKIGENKYVLVASFEAAVGDINWKRLKRDDDPNRTMLRLEDSSYMEIDVPVAAIAKMVKTVAQTNEIVDLSTDGAIAAIKKRFSPK